MIPSLSLLQKGKDTAVAEADTDTGKTEEVHEETPSTDALAAQLDATAAEEEGAEAVDVDVDKMTLAEIDALVKEHQIDVPPHWWKKTDGIKKLTVGEKRTWLKEQYEEAPEEEAETPAETAGNSSENAAAAAEKESSTVVAAPVGASVSPKETGTQVAVSAVNVGAEQILDASDLTDMVHSIENLKETEARAMAVTLQDAAERTYFQLGGVLSLIQSNGWFTPYTTFREYIETEFGMHYRKAMYLVSIYGDLTKQDIPWSKVQHVGWTKMAALSPILTPDNVDHWVNVAGSNNTSTVEAMVKSAMQNESQTTAKLTGPDVESAPTVTTKTFKLHGDQKDTVEAALSKAKEMATTSVDTVALEYICLDFMGSKKAKTLTALMKEKGLDSTLEALEKAFPDVTFSVELPAAAAAE